MDGTAVRDRSDRLRTLFLESRDVAVAQWRRIADESARFNIGSIQRNFNTPTTALFFFQAANQPRFRFRKAAEETIDGVSAWKVEYEERRKPTIIRTPKGKDMPVHGAVWFDPATGRVFRTTLALSVEVHVTPPVPVVIPGGSFPVSPRTGTPPQPTGNPLVTEPALARKSEVSVGVTYAADERLGLFVPIEMHETYQRLEGGRTVGRATYTDFKRFETGTKVIIK